MAIFFFWIVLSFLVGFAGKEREIGFGAAFMLALVLSPLIGGIIVLSKKKLEDIEREKEEKEDRKKQNELLEKSIEVQEVKTTFDSEDTITKLERLSKLKDKGMLTESEFESQKAKLLA